MSRTALLTLALLVVAGSSGCNRESMADSPAVPAVEQQLFDSLVARSSNLTFQQLTADTPPRNYVEQLSFDPVAIDFYEQTAKELQLTEAEKTMLRSQGFVSVDHGQRYSFGSLYYAIYTRDLPVLVTTDSILHAMHRTYDDILMEIEQTFFTMALDDVLARCHDELGREPSRGAATNRRDVDLYLTVARNLLLGAGAPAAERASQHLDQWDGTVLVPSRLGQNDAVKELLEHIQSLELQSPQRGEKTQIYGGERAIDYSQFQPRGHYLKTAALARYFRTMMWLGRADTGWNILPPDPQSGIVSDSRRELQDAVVLTQLLQSTGSAARLQQMSAILDFMVGEADNLTVEQFADLLKEHRISSVSDLASRGQIESLQNALRQSNVGAQRIRSQVLFSDPNDLHQVQPPSTFQLFGQRFVIDSFVLSKVVYDSILFDGKKVERKMPVGADVMFALGNDTVLPLLEKGMTEFPYAANLKASQQFVERFPPEFWSANLYNIWLDAVRTLSADRASDSHLPEAMRTSAWQRKQLQTQLASWSELRHNTVLYVKQSYTIGERCEYPAGYVEPYPETFARIKLFAEEAARRIESADFSLPGRDFTGNQRRQIAFLKQMAETLGRLEGLARKELAAEPFTADDQEWLKKVIDMRGGGSGPPQYTGWYCQLFYGGGVRCEEWNPTIVDVHTDPDSQTVLEAGVGDCNFLVVAVDNEGDRRIYVGPTYSYYEFHHPAEQRLTDQTWSEMLSTDNEPSRPAWTDTFQGAKQKRELGK